MEIWLIFLIWLVLIFLNMPIGFSLILAGFLYFLTNDWSVVYAAGSNFISGIDSFTLLAVPFFILTGALMNSSGITDSIFNFARSTVGHVKGGIGHVNILASLIFAGKSGSALADAGGLGQLEIKSMREAGYHDDINGGLTASSAILSGIIPPSINLIIYAAIANVSVAQMFAAGIVPGLLISLSLFGTMYFLARKRNYPIAPRAPFREVLRSFGKSFWALITPVIIIGGILSGFFTPTEAAAVSTVYALFLGFVVYRQLTIRKVVDNFVYSLKLTGVVVLMMMGVEFFGQFIARERVPTIVADFFLTITENPILLLIIISLLLLILGTFIEALALLVLVVPVLIPVILNAGIDPVFFGVFVIINLMIGILTPPMGMALFVVSRVGEIPMGTMYRGVIPFIIPFLFILLVVIFFPQIITFVPEMLR
ncbi:TRAP transporter large permease [Alkalicoccus luteus]|uniref:TRAP transporter large permease n=1 Tax=Alkalicoccus luteus TaxID=1237094 RepID=UPI0040343BF2